MGINDNKKPEPVVIIKKFIPNIIFDTIYDIQTNRKRTISRPMDYTDEQLEKHGWVTDTNSEGDEIYRRTYKNNVGEDKNEISKYNPFYNVTDSFMNTRDCDIREYLNKMKIINENIKKVDLDKAESIYKSYIDSIKFNRRNEFNTDVLLKYILSISKDLYSNSSNTCHHLCAIELCKYFKTNVSNYRHVTISKQSVANFKVN